MQPVDNELVSLRDRRVLVTGGAGFLGSEITRQLWEQKAVVTVLDNFSSGKEEYISGLEGVTVVHGDIRDKEIVSMVMKDQEIVIHLAALPFIPDSFYYPNLFFSVNVTGSLNLIQEAIDSKEVERFVHISSSEVYGSAKYVPMDEEHPTVPQSTYAVSKLAADRAIYTLHKERGFPVVIVRPFNSYGPNITQPYIIPEIIIQCLKGKKEIELGNVESSRDLTYVKDTVRGILLASTKNKAIGEVINLGTGVDTKVRELASLISNLMSVKISITHDPTRLRPWDVERLVCDYTKAAKILNWRPEITLNEGLQMTIEWVRKVRLRFSSPFKGWQRCYVFPNARVKAEMPTSAALGY